MNEEMFITEIRTFLDSLSFKVSKDKHNVVYKYLLTQTHHKKKGLLPLGYFRIEKKKRFIPGSLSVSVYDNIGAGSLLNWFLTGPSIYKEVPDIQYSHFLYSMPSGGLTSVFLSPISFQFVLKTVPPDSLNDFIIAFFVSSVPSE